MACRRRSQQFLTKSCRRTRMDNRINLCWDNASMWKMFHSKTKAKPEKKSLFKNGAIRFAVSKSINLLIKIYPNNPISTDLWQGKIMIIKKEELCQAALKFRLAVIQLNRRWNDDSQWSAWHTNQYQQDFRINRELYQGRMPAK